MSRVKIKKIKQGKIDASAFSMKRRLEVEIDTVEALMKSASETVSRKKKRDKNRKKKRAKKRRKAPTRIIQGDKIKAPPPSKVTLDDMVTIHEDGHAEWKDHIPVEFEPIINQINAIYNVKDEIKSYSLSIWPPRQKHKSGTINETTIPKAAISTAMRVILTVGHREVYHMSAESKGEKGTGEVICFSGDSFSIPIGVSSAIEYKFNDQTIFYREARKGHRKTKIVKDPSKVYVCVIDGSVNTSAVIEIIKKEALKLTGGNKSKARELQSKTNKMFGLEDVNEVLQATKEMKFEEDEEVPELIPMNDVQSVLSSIQEEPNDGEEMKGEPISEPKNDIQSALSYIQEESNDGKTSEEIKGEHIPELVLVHELSTREEILQHYKGNRGRMTLLYTRLISEEEKSGNEPSPEAIKMRSMWKILKEDYSGAD